MQQGPVKDSASIYEKANNFLLTFIYIKSKLLMNVRVEQIEFKFCANLFKTYLDELYNHICSVSPKEPQISLVQQFSELSGMLLEIFQEHFTNELLKNNTALIKEALNIIKECTLKTTQIAKKFRSSHPENKLIQSTFAVALLNCYGEQHSMYQHLNKPDLALYAANKMLDNATLCFEYTKEQTKKRLPQYPNPIVVTKDAQANEVQATIYSSLCNYYSNLGYYGKGVECITKAVPLFLAEVDINVHNNLNNYIQNFISLQRWHLAYRLQKLQIEHLNDSALSKLTPQTRQYFGQLKSEGQRKLLMLKQIYDRELPAKLHSASLRNCKVSYENGILRFQSCKELNSAKALILKALEDVGIHGMLQAEQELVIQDYYQYSPRKLLKTLQKVEALVNNPTSSDNPVNQLAAAIGSTTLTESPIALSGPEMKKGIYFLRPLKHSILPQELKADQIERLQSLLQEGKIVNKRHPGLHIARRTVDGQDRLQLCLKTPEIPYKVEIEPVSTSKDPKGRTQIIFEATHCIKKSSIR